MKPLALLFRSISALGPARSFLAASGIVVAAVPLFSFLGGLHAAEAPLAGVPAPPRIEIRRFLPDQPVSRALRPAPVSADVINLGDGDVDVTATLRLPPGVRVLGTSAERKLRLASSDGEERLTWELEANAALAGELKLELAVGGNIIAEQLLAMRFLPAVQMRQLPYLPEPKPAPTEMLVGAHHCPLWEADKPNMWLNVLKHPERTPALGFYAQENPEVADWETKWAVEHGISFFIYCWYRTSQGGAVKTQFGSAIHDALFKSKFADKMKFTIMWENQSRGKAGVADERDLFENLLPYWMDNYFKHPSYLKVDNQPVLFIYRPEFLVQDLGGVPNVLKAFEKMRRVCREAGFDGLYLLGEYRGTDPKHLALMKSLGLDYTFAYCWYVHDNPTPERAIRTQMEYIRKTQELNILPQVVTVSQAWSGWADEGTIWKIPPPEFEQLLRQAKDFTATLPKHQLGSRLLLLDNWNEWGEGHYLAPYREYGFGYLDAVRNVFSTAPREHEDLLPEDIGRGPYDTAIRGHFERERQHRRLMTRKVTKPGAPEGLAAWWTFDEETNSPVALDVSGHRLGGGAQQAGRAAGFEGGALVCNGGSVVVPNDPQLSALKKLTIECRVKTEVAGQDNKWMLNRVFGDSPSSGFRLGVLRGNPCFHVPLTDWSHHLTASEPLPTGRWVHLAATFDGKTMRLYVDGVERGTMERPGEIRPNNAPLVLGNYEVGHSAYFNGLLDDVRLYGRVLTPEEIRARAAVPPGPPEAKLPPDAEAERSAVVLPNDFKTAEWRAMPRPASDHWRFIRRDYPAANAVEWQVRLRAPDQGESPLWQEARSADFMVMFPSNPAVTVHWSEGSHASPWDFKPREDALQIGKPLVLESFGGRSSDGVMPYFNLAAAGGGLIVAVGWTGDWRASFESVGAGKVRVSAGLKRANFKLLPGEEVRLPSVLVMSYRGDWLDGQNQFRRLMLQEFSPTNHPPMELMPVAASVHGLIGFNDTTTTNLSELAALLAQARLPLDTFWLDAGWNQGGFPLGQGNPDPDPARFALGLPPVGEAARKAGLRFLAWFEPERVMRGTWLDRERSHWLLLPSGTPPELRYQERDGFRLFDLGNPEARRWATEQISQQIHAAGIAIYRQDCNLYPAHYWHTEEPPDRVGLREIRYITGLYDFLDELARRHPGLILDNCASGGRRLDFEMMRRSVVLWRSDSCWDATSFPRNAQAMTHGLSLWLPAHGLGAAATDDLALRSGMGACASFAINFRDSAAVETLRRHLARYLKARPLFTKDYYPLTPWSEDASHWMAFQFHDPASGEGLVQVFQGSAANDRNARLPLRGLDAALTYTFSNWDDPQASRSFTGRELMSGGLPVSIRRNGEALVFTYKSNK